jgi:hypothetical protein
MQGHITNLNIYIKLLLTLDSLSIQHYVFYYVLCITNREAFLWTVHSVSLQIIHENIYIYIYIYKLNSMV